VGHATADGDTWSEGRVDVRTIAVREDDVGEIERRFVVPPLPAEASPRWRASEYSELDLDAAPERRDETVIAVGVGLRSVDEATTRQGPVLRTDLKASDPMPIRRGCDTATDEDSSRERLVDTNGVAGDDQDVCLAAELLVVPPPEVMRMVAERKLMEVEDVSATGYGERVVSERIGCHAASACRVDTALHACVERLDTDFGKRNLGTPLGHSSSDREGFRDSRGELSVDPSNVAA